MRSNIFACILKVAGVPMFLVKWLLKAIWFLTYGFVGILYKLTLISGVRSGKIAYTVTSIILLVGLITMINFIKN